MIRAFVWVACCGAMLLAGASSAQDEKLEGIPQMGMEQPKGDPGDLVLRLGFTFNSSVVPETVRNHLDKVAELLANERAAGKVEVAGHTDALGSDDVNERLSTQRAESVKQYLVQHGVDAGRISAIGYGKARPRASNDTKEGRRLNRRVEIRVTG